jgi:hypothetical protein
MSMIRQEKIDPSEALPIFFGDAKCDAPAVVLESLGAASSSALVIASYHGSPAAINNCFRTSLNV